jgi:hypothetical protein
MTALSKFLVLLALFLSASHAHALSSVAGHQVWVVHLIQLQQPMSNPTNKPSFEPICKPTKQMDLDAELPNNFPLKKTRVAYSEPKQNAEHPRKITDLTITQPRGLCHGKKPELESLAEQPIAATNSSQCGLCHDNKSELESFADQPGIDEEIDHPIAATNSSQNQWQMPTPINLNSCGL